MAESMQRDVALGAFFMGMAQAILWAAVGLWLGVVAVKFQGMFADFGTELPTLSVAVLTLAAIVARFWYVTVVLCCVWPLVSLGIVRLLSLKPEVTLPRRIWYVVSWAAPLLLAVLTVAGIVLPMATLMSGLNS